MLRVWSSVSESLDWIDFASTIWQLLLSLLSLRAPPRFSHRTTPIITIHVIRALQSLPAALLPLPTPSPVPTSPSSLSDGPYLPETNPVQLPFSLPEAAAVETVTSVEVVAVVEEEVTPMMTLGSTTGPTQFSLSLRYIQTYMILLNKLGFFFTFLYFTVTFIAE